MQRPTRRPAAAAAAVVKTYASLEGTVAEFSLQPPIVSPRPEPQL